MAEPWDGATPTDNPDIWENENGFFSPTSPSD